MSIKDGNEKMSAYFIEKAEADLNFREKNGKTALMYACESGNHTVVGLLLKKNADPNIVDKVCFIYFMYLILILLFF
jgi:ankyrin repeat protein